MVALTEEEYRQIALRTLADAEGEMRSYDLYYALIDRLQAHDYQKFAPIVDHPSPLVRFLCAPIAFYAETRNILLSWQSERKLLKPMQKLAQQDLVTIKKHPHFPDSLALQKFVLARKGRMALANISVV